MNLVSKDVEDYALSHSLRESDVFRRLATVTRRKTTLPQMQVGALEGAFLRVLVRATGAKRILEIGTFTGYSALAMAAATPPGGRVITLDRDPDATAIARQFWGADPHGRKIRLVLGDALTRLRAIKGPFDLVFIDADKENYEAYWEACVPRVRRGGLLVVDNTLWSGRVLAPKDATDRAIVRFNRAVARDRRVETVLIPLRDGVTLAWKR